MLEPVLHNGESSACQACWGSSLNRKEKAQEAARCVVAGRPYIRRLGFGSSRGVFVGCRCRLPVPLPTKCLVRWLPHAWMAALSFHSERRPGFQVQVECRLF